MTKELITMDQDRTKSVLGEVLAERIKQHEQWGDQRFPFHADVDGDGTPIMGDSYATVAHMLKLQCDLRHTLADHGQEHRSNALVLLEEVFEALAETDPARIREELIQVAAVAVKAVEVLDREGE